MKYTHVCICMLTIGISTYSFSAEMAGAAFFGAFGAKAADRYSDKIFDAVEENIHQVNTLMNSVSNGIKATAQGAIIGLAGYLRQNNYQADRPHVQPQPAPMSAGHDDAAFNQYDDESQRHRGRSRQRAPRRARSQWSTSPTRHREDEDWRDASHSPESPAAYARHEEEQIELDHAIALSLLESISPAVRQEQADLISALRRSKFEQ